MHPRYQAHQSIIERIVDAGVDEDLAESFFSQVASTGALLDNAGALQQFWRKADDAVGSESLPGVRFNNLPVTVAVRDEILGKLAAAEHVELEVDIVGFLQTKGEPNRNFMRLLDKKMVLRATARSGNGMPFLANHDHRHVESRLGTIARSAAVFDSDTVKFRQTLRVSTPDGVAGIIRGTIDRFSVGWIATGEVMCSLCKTPIFTECFHFPGEEVELGDDAESEAAVVEWVFTSADLIEVSAVNVPAVVGTGIEEVRASLAQNHKPPARPASKETGMSHEELCKLLGLPTDASQDDVRAAIAKQAADSARTTELQTHVAQLEADKAVGEAAAIDARILKLKAEGKLAAKGGKVEEKLREMAEMSFDTFAAYCDAMPQVVPVTQQTHDVEDVAITGESTEAETAAALEANPYLKRALGTLGLTGEDVRKYGPKRPMGESLLSREHYSEGGN